MRAHYPESLLDLVTWTTEMSNDYYASAGMFSLPRNSDGSFRCPLMSLNNDGQRILLAFFLHHILAYFDNDQVNLEHDINDLIRMIIIGVAGVGKSFVMDIVNLFVRLLSGEMSFSKTVAPTGAAAGNCSGSTCDREFSFNRKDKEYTPLTRPKVEQMQLHFYRTMLLMFDEMSMLGQLMFGHLSRRMDDVMNGGVVPRDYDSEPDPLFGLVQIFAIFGDHMQLSPVLGTPNFFPVLPSKSENLKRIGNRSYSKLDKSFILDEPVRQQVGDFYDALTGARNGTADEHVSFWESLSYDLVMMNANAEKKALWDMTNPNTLYMTCFNKERDEINVRYIQRFQRVHVCKANVNGKHATPLKDPSMGACKQIPRTNYIGVNMMAKLTTNICPELKLFNGSRGIIRDILYLDVNGTDCGYASANPHQIVCMVEFPDYSGPPINETMATHGQGKWVPIVFAKKMCDKKCCYREGLPIAVAKADSTHSCQGMSAGDGESIERVIFQWEKNAEGKWPNIFYVGVSRAKKEENLLLGKAVTTEGLKSIGKSDSYVRKRAEINRITSKAMSLRTELQQQGIGTKHAFCNQLLRLCHVTRSKFFQPNSDTNPIVKEEMENFLSQLEEKLSSSDYVENFT